MEKTIVIGADHRGFKLKEEIKKQYSSKEWSVNWHDVGSYSAERSDYPDFANEAVQMILTGKADFALLLCGTGIGMAIAANRYKNIYAGVAWSPEIARRGREEDSVNVLCIPADYCTYEQVKLMIDAFLEARPKEGRYAERVRKLDQ